MEACQHGWCGGWAVPYWEAHAVAWSCLAALADLEGVGSWHYDLLLIELDSLHLVFPTHYWLAGSREVPMLILEISVHRMIVTGDRGSDSI